MRSFSHCEIGACARLFTTKIRKNSALRKTFRAPPAMGKPRLAGGARLATTVGSHARCSGT
eukprot:4694614-Alexandrium_andersonii.AAC.1